MILWIILRREYWEEAFDRLELYLKTLQAEDCNDR